MSSCGYYISPWDAVGETALSWVSAEAPRQEMDTTRWRPRPTCSRAGLGQGGSRTQRSESLEQVQALKPRPSRCRDLPEPYLPPYCVTLVLLRPRRLFVPLHGVRKIVSQISRWEAVPSFPGKGSLSPLDRNVATWALKPHPPSFHLAKRKQRGGLQAEVNAKYPAGSGRLPHLFLPLKAGP